MRFLRVSGICIIELFHFKKCSLIARFLIRSVPVFSSDYKSAYKIKTQLQFSTYRETVLLILIGRVQWKSLYCNAFQFFLGSTIMISTGRTRQDSDKWFLACETLEKICGINFFWPPRLITSPEISHLNCSKLPKKTFFCKLPVNR